ncbi:MAG: hypothetical protein AABW51_02910 [Nanoarchaeota archaeon]
MTKINEFGEKVRVGVTVHGKHYRDITLAPKKFKVEAPYSPCDTGASFPFELVPVYDQFLIQENSKLINIAIGAIHNFLDLRTNRYDMGKNELYVTLYTEDSSYNLSAFYEALTNAGYTIK